MLIEGGVDLGELRALGAQPTVRIGTITGAIVPVSSLAALSNLPTVERIEAARIQTATNDLARIDSGADLARDPLPGYDGSGVVVGIIDTGIDFTHEDFLHPDGTTRIKALLDVTDAGPHPSGGTVFSEADINAELASPGSTVPETDTDGHGTHVAGSAAGDGSAANGGSAPAGTYAGIAPASDLVIVKAGSAGFSQDAILAGLAFVRDTAADLGQPWVANLSLGSDLGAHDGTSLYEQAIDGFVGPSDNGAAIVVAAGNSGADDIHARGGVVQSTTGSPITTELTTSIPSDISVTYYDLWYEGTDDFRFGWKAPNGAFIPAQFDWFPVDSQFTDCTVVLAGNNCVTVTHVPNSPLNGDKRIFIKMESAGGVDLLPGTWTFQLEGDAVAVGLFDAWSLRNYTPFTSNINNDYRVGTPGTATEVITVGAYGTNPATGQAVGPATTFSAPGPTRDLRQKPEIIAPGAAIFSSFSSDAPGDFGVVAPGGLHVGTHGTSMATPVVTGAIALLLQVDPTLDAIEIRDLLISTAREDEFTGGIGSGWESKTGYGKLNIYAALAALLQTDIATSTVSAADSTVPADGITSTTVTVTLVDGVGNPVLGHYVILGEDGGIADVTPDDLGVTNSAGVATYTVTSSTPGLSTLSAFDLTDGVLITDTAEITFGTLTSDPNNSTVDATDPSVAANGVASTTVTVTLLDSLGDPVPSHNVTLSQGGGSSDISDGGLGTTDGAGQVAFTVTNTTTELVTYSAEDTTDTVSVVETADVDFVEPVTDAGTSTVTATDPTVIADTVSNTTVTVTLLDSDSEPLDGHNVTLSQDGSSTIVGGNTGATDGSGEVTFTVTSDTVETVTYTAEDTTDGVTVTETADVEFTPLPSDPDQSSVVITGDSAVPADGATSTTITVTLLNELDDPIVGHTVTLDQDGGSSVIFGGAATDGSGQTVFTVTNTTQEFVTYTATDDTDSVTITDTVEVEFTEIPSDAAQSTVAASPLTVLANGVGESTITVTLRSSSGTPVGGHAVTLGQDGGASISGGGDTNGAGEVTFTVTNITTGIVIFDATDTTSGVDVTQTAQVEFIEPTTDAGQSTVTAADPVVEADGVASTTVTVTLSDADGAPLTGHAVTLSQGAGSSAISGGGVGVTNGSGQATFTVTDNTVEDVFYSVNDDTDGVAVSQTAKVRFLIADEDASLSNLTLTAGKLSPAFNPDTLGYSATVSNGITSTNVTPTTTQPGSTLTINGDAATSGASVVIDLNVGANPVEIVVTAPDATTTATYTLTVNRAAPPAPIIFIPPPPPPQLRVDLTLTNDDGGEATLEDFTILVDDLTELTSGEPVLLTFGGHLVSLTGPTAFYSIEFGGTCFEDGTVILLGGLSICTAHLDDQPIGLVLSEALPDAAALIDESLSLTDDAFDRDGTAYVEASSAGTPPEITVAVPVDAIPGGGAITILVSPANELAIGQSPPPGSLLIGGTGYVIQILDGDGNPITDFLLPLELSFLLPDGAGPVEAYSYDAELGIWVLEPGSTTGNRFELTPNHLTTFALFGIAPDGGLIGTAPSRGIWLTTAEGGSVIQLRRALLEAGAVGAFVTHQGHWVSYLPSAPDFVNQGFQDFFAAGIPQGQVLLISMDR